MRSLIYLSVAVMTLGCQHESSSDDSTHPAQPQTIEQKNASMDAELAATREAQRIAAERDKQQKLNRPPPQN